MKCLRVILFSFTVSFFSSTLLAEEVGTPDGYTPSNEGVCDVLIQSTPGLYGLCVAFCEAQDHFDESVPVTQDEVEQYVSEARRANQIYENYNKRKDINDPEMPCVVIQNEQCPCWDEVEIDTIATTNGIYVSNNISSYILDGFNLFFVGNSRKGDSSCRFRYLGDDGSLVVRSMLVSPEENSVCLDSLSKKAYELGL
ncbi:hypothetical protein DMW20_12045 [Vibrio parahaemolyticus]|nr:hypothetical protein [Vibrio parahaemolyticus]